MNRPVNNRTPFVASPIGIVWVLAPLLAAVFVVSIFFLPLPFLSVVGVLLIGALGVPLYAAQFSNVRAAPPASGGELQSILHGLADALIVYDKDFRVTLFNPAAERLFRVEEKTLLGIAITPKDVERPELRLLVQVIYPALAPTLVTRSEPGAYPIIADVSFDDPPLELRVLTAPVLGSQGEAVGFMKIVRDRTREVFLTKSKYEFITIASHQLKGPVTNIVWALDALGKDVALGEESKDLIKNATQAGRLLLDIVEALLTVSKIEEGRFGYNFASLDIADFVKTVLVQATPQAKRVGVTVYFNAPKDPLPAVIADPEKLTTVFQNLLDNAIRYNVKGGEVTVGLEKVENAPFIKVLIKDTGIGIPPGDKEKIFGKFFRAENAIKAATEGSGLGLYITKNIVRAHGGELWFDSEINRGTTLYFTLATDPAKVPQREAPMEY